jgi:hypothetical protein
MLRSHELAVLHHSHDFLSVLKMSLSILHYTSMTRIKFFRFIQFIFQGNLRKYKYYKANYNKFSFIFSFSPFDLLVEPEFQVMSINIITIKKPMNAVGFSELTSQVLNLLI